MKHLFIVNPVAGGSDKTEFVRDAARRVFGDDFEIYVTKAPMDAADEIKRRAAGGEELWIYACGGDGTFNECCCGAAGLDNVSLCPFPTGTGNDFCRMFGSDAEKYRDLAAIARGHIHPIDLIDCNGRYSVNICSAGIDARIGTNVHKYSTLPLVGGATAYVISSVVEMFKGISRRVKVSAEGFYADGPHTLICACNGRYYGGGFNPSVDAMPDDGIMDVLVTKKVSLPVFAALIGKYAAGRATELKKYVTHLRVKELTLEFDGEDVLNIDGEAMYAQKVTMRIAPHALRLIVPDGMTFFD